MARALSGRYTLVILDVQLRDRDGLDVLRELHEWRSSLPVLLLSAKGDLPTRLRGFELALIDTVRGVGYRMAA